MVVVATTGMTALPAVLAALRAGRRVALANKETLVTGGHLVAAALDAAGGDPLDRLRPIDSEHSAIWQCLLGERIDDVARLVLTASGGPFRDRPPADLASVTPDEALAHPTWQMGPKITIDSATLVNKAFEVMEARWLYRLPYSRIDAVIHPRSVVHSLVEFTDGSYKAQLGLPDMRLPIQYAAQLPRPPALAGASRRARRLGRAGVPAARRRAVPGVRHGSAARPQRAATAGRSSTRPTRWRWRPSWPAACPSRASAKPSRTRSTDGGPMRSLRWMASWRLDAEVRSALTAQLGTGVA